MCDNDDFNNSKPPQVIISISRVQHNIIILLCEILTHFQMYHVFFYIMYGLFDDLLPLFISLSSVVQPDCWLSLVIDPMRLSSTGSAWLLQKQIVDSQKEPPSQAQV